MVMNYYFGIEESHDEYVFCDQCGDFVLEYCSLHGALLVIPDSKVQSNLHPPYVPRAALTIPNLFIHISRSTIPGAGLGVFASRTLSRGVRFGPYKGDIKKEVNSSYCWQLHDASNRPSHIVDAQNATRSNWMRYVNGARHYTEQNILAFQYQGQLYYRTIKKIPRFSELLVFYGSEYASSLNISLQLYNLPIRFETNDYQNKEVEFDNRAFEDKAQENISNKNTVTDIFDVKKLDNETDMSEETRISFETYEHNVQNNNVHNVKHNNVQNVANSVLTKTVVVCNECYAQFQSKFDLIEHIKCHSTFICNLCNYHSTDIDVFTKHLYAKHSNINHGFESAENESDSINICLFCDMEFIDRNKLKEHSLYHTGENISSNPLRAKTLKNTSLVRHLKIHHEKNIPCTKCNKTFSTNRYLYGHIRRVHEENEMVSCTLCPRTFKNKEYLRKHLKTHENSKTKACSICFKRFINEINFRRHLSSHK